MRHLRSISIAAAFGMVFTLAPVGLAEKSAQATGDSPDTCLVMHGGDNGDNLAAPTLNGNVYEISTVNQLVYLSENFDQFVSGGSGEKWRQKDFVQTEPIDLGGCLFTPIGSTNTTLERFEGRYNGQFHPISGLVVNKTEMDVGFFGATGVATIERIVLADASITGRTTTGSLIGNARETTILESSATGSVTGIVGGLHVGGLVGYMETNSTVSRSFADVTVTAESFNNVGGLIGTSIGSSITASYALGSVKGKDRVGGLVGTRSEGDTIAQSFSANSVSGQNDVGGLAGRSSDSQAVAPESFWDITISGLGSEDQISGSAGGTGKTTAQLRTLSTFTNTQNTTGLGSKWDIVDGWEEYAPNDDKVWGIRADLNDGYPFLLWEYSLDRPLCPTPNEADVYEIAHEFHLIAVGSGGANDSCGLADNYLQIADIDLGTIPDWTPIGDRDSRFRGEFDGGNHTISNLTITTSGDDRGLFGYVGTDGKVGNVNLETVTIDLNSASDSVGGLAGTNDGTISNSYAAVEIKTDPGENVGGLVGVNRGTIVQAHSAGEIQTDKQSNRIGGLAGYNRGVVSESSSSVTVTGRGTSNSVGGFVGVNQIAGNISTSFATGNVAGNQNIGGFVGSNELGSSTISNSYSLGDVSGVNRVGAFFGLNLNEKITSSYSTGEATEGGAPRGFGVTSQTATVTASFWQTPTPGTTVVSSGEAKTEPEMKTLSTFADADWSISCQSGTPATTWGIAPTINQGYPFLVALNDSSFNGCATPSTQDTTSSPSSSGNATLEAEAEDTLTQTPFSGFRQPATTTPNTDTTTPVIPESDTSSQDSTESPTADGLGSGDTTQDATTPPTSPSGVSTWWLWGIGSGGLGAAALIAGGVAWARGRV